MDRIEDRACKLALAMAELKNKNSYHSYKDTMVSIYKPVEKMIKPYSRLERISQEWLSRLGEMKKSKELDVSRLKRYFYGTSVYSLASTISNIMFNEHDDTTMIADFIKFIYNLDTEDKFNRFMTYYYRYYARSNTSSNLIEQRDTAKGKHDVIEIMFSDKYNREAVDNIYKHHPVFIDDDTLSHPFVSLSIFKDLKTKVVFILKIV